MRSDISNIMDETIVELNAKESENIMNSNFKDTHI
jgi:hypothetical protein